MSTEAGFNFEQVKGTLPVEALVISPDDVPSMGDLNFTHTDSD